MPNPTFTFPDHVVFNRTIDAVRKSSEEQVRIERAIGRAFLDRLAGKQTSLLAAYGAIGGDDPIAKQIFTEMETKFTAIKLDGARTAAATVVNKPAVAASKVSEVRADNPVFKVDYTALNTLADLGGAEFARKYNIH